MPGHSSSATARRSGAISWPAATALEVVGRLGVGLDNIDLDGCRALGIQVIPATGANDLAVAEYVVTRRPCCCAPPMAPQPPCSAGEWPREALMGRELPARPWGLVGLGAIARL
jgi:(S)-sulfolactate dehydrogenase